NLHGVTIASAGRIRNQERIFRRERAVAFAAPTFVQSRRAAAAAGWTGGPRANVHLHAPAELRFFGSEHHFHGQRFESFGLGSADCIEVAPQAIEDFVTGWALPR